MGSSTSAGLPALYPVVIRSIEVTKGRYKFTCSGENLRTNGFAFDADVQSALPLLEPACTKKGTIKVNQPDVKQTTVDYWKAQCVFRGLPTSGTKKDLQQRIRDALATHSKDAMLQEYESEEVRLVKEFRLKNAAEHWLSLSTRAKADPERFLKETFGKASKDYAVIVKTEHRAELHQAAEKAGMGLRTCSANAPMDEKGERSGPDRWIVIGNSMDAVMKKVNEIESETNKAKQRMRAQQEKRTNAMQAQVANSTASKSRKDTEWDVTGKWVIESEELEGFGNYGDPPQYTMDIMLGVDGNQKAQMFAHFDFDSVTGIMRFVNSGQGGTASKKTATKRPATDDDESDNDSDSDALEEEEDYYGNEVSVYEPSFVLHPPFKPSTKNKKWLFRWRGEETGEGEIQLASDTDLNSISFDGPGGTECSGIMQVSFVGRVEFTGRKVQKGKGAGSYISALSTAKSQWEQRGEKAYERARVGRWH